MCGIHFSLSRSGFRAPSDGTRQLLESRGPDSARQYDVVVRPGEPATGPLYLSFFSTVLSLRGETVVAQPLVDSSTGSVLCWNGDVWKIRGRPVYGNDTESVFKVFVDACSKSRIGVSPYQGMIEAISLLSGPYAFVFYDAPHQRIYYGRDCLGRRSLLKSTVTSNDFLISSVCTNATGEDWSEVEADGIYVVELAQAPLHQGDGNAFRVVRIPSHASSSDHDASTLRLPWAPLNKAVPGPAKEPLGLLPPSVALLERHLRASLELRILHLGNAALHGKESDGTSSANIAILFSGGLDCAVLARLCHDILPPSESIDLLNVAFQNPRVHKSSDEDGKSSPYELCPDRITGRKSFKELQDVCSGRTWRFVEVNVPYTETLAHRTKVIELMHPHNTEMDLSIAFALYFASRGIGKLTSTEGAPVDYATPARVLLSGLGADELFGGYQRHATAFERHGFKGLLDELDLDINRLGKRNLGRDDRVISNWAREVRFPYLDEDLLKWALDAPVWQKCGFGQVDAPDGPTVEPGKKVLRLVAWKLGMKGVASEKKRAIQFGARTAKMEVGRTKGTHVIS